jgi:hypothetical protein
MDKAVLIPSQMKRLERTAAATAQRTKLASERMGLHGLSRDVLASRRSQHSLLLFSGEVELGATLEVSIAALHKLCLC